MNPTMGMEGAFVVVDHLGVVPGVRRGGSASAVRLGEAGDGEIRTLAAIADSEADIGGVRGLVHEEGGVIAPPSQVGDGDTGFDVGLSGGGDEGPTQHVLGHEIRVRVRETRSQPLPLLFRVHHGIHCGCCLGEQPWGRVRARPVHLPMWGLKLS